MERNKVLRALKVLIEENPKSGYCEYGVQYAKAIFGNDLHGEALDIQISYILANLSAWRGEAARETKKVLKDYQKWYKKQSKVKQ